MIMREERDTAIDQVDAGFIEMLKGWMDTEKGNLDAFIANPLEHVNYDKFVQPDFNALELRSEQLGQVSQASLAIFSYKNNLGATRSQHDYGLDRIPSAILGRLLDWLKTQYMEMLVYQEKQHMAPIKEYEGLFTFDQAKYEAELNRFETAIAGLEVVYQYAKEREV